MATSLQNASDSELLDIAAAAKATLTAHLADYDGLVTADLTALDDAVDQFNDRVNTHISAKAAAASARAAKDESRDVDLGLEPILRRIRNVAKTHGATEAE